MSIASVRALEINATLDDTEAAIVAHLATLDLSGDTSDYPVLAELVEADHLDIADDLIARARAVQQVEQEDAE